MRGVGDAAPYRHNPQSFSLPQMGTAARGLAALQPHLKICVGDPVREAKENWVTAHQAPGHRACRE